MGLFTNSGFLAMIDFSNDSTIWELQFNDFYFPAEKTKIGDNDAIVCCSFNGDIQFVDEQSNILQFEYKQQINAFKCGKFFSKSEKKNLPCLILHSNEKSEIAIIPISVSSIICRSFFSYVKNVIHETQFISQKSDDPTENEKRDFDFLSFLTSYDFSQKSVSDYKLQLQNRLSELKNLLPENN